MSEHSGQNLQNHTHIEAKGIMSAFLSFITIILGVAAYVTGNTKVLSLGLLFAGLTGFVVFFTARTYAVRLQDRIIRTEMYLRMEKVLEPELVARAESLSIPQLIALRFASDAELAELVTKVLDEDIRDLKSIKRLVKDWQGDYHRV
jgi:predicted phage-related endonuclease